MSLCPFLVGKIGLTAYFLGHASRTGRRRWRLESRRGRGLGDDPTVTLGCRISEKHTGSFFHDFTQQKHTVIPKKYPRFQWIIFFGIQMASLESIRSILFFDQPYGCMSETIPQNWKEEINPPKIGKWSKTKHHPSRGCTGTLIDPSTPATPQAVEPAELDRSLGCCIRGQKS